MNLSKNKVKIRTCDGHIIRKGDFVYHIYLGNPITKIKVKAWHDGREAYPGLLKEFGRYSKDYCVSMKGRGGKGVYPWDEDNIFSFIPQSCLFKYVKNVRKYWRIFYAEQLKRSQVAKPAYYRTTYYQ